ncbi:MAG: hypothetical protein WKF96_01455 [Solirubrobacteraceae bacterium]
MGAEKASEGAASACRRGGPEDACATATPAGRDVRPSKLAAYQASWLHRAAANQFRLGDPVAFRDAQWLGSHNSFNANANGPTPSHADSNQQLTLTQQLDGDIRSLELDVHLVAGVLRVCHARPAAEGHAGCSTEDDLATVLKEIEAWLKANPGQVILLYLEDHVGDAGYAAAKQALDQQLPGRVYAPAAGSATGCTELPLELSRAAVATAGKQVVLVGKCRAGWSSHVFGWTENNEVEAGNSTGYACDKPFARSDYATKMVRFFEDGTWLATGLAPQENMAANRARRLTPDKVAAMVRCGVNLFGFDHFDPNDGRVAASIWSWAPDEPQRTAGDCTVQRDDTRWYAAACTGSVRPAACRTAQGWALSRAVTARGARAACASRGSSFDPPRTGEENAAVGALPAGEVWVAA